MYGDEAFDSWPQSSSEAELDAAATLAESLYNAGWREVSSCFEQVHVQGSLPRVVLKALDVPFVYTSTGTTYVADAVQTTMELWTDRYVAVCLGALEHLPRATPEDRGLSFDSVYGYLSRALDVRPEHEVAVLAVDDLGGAEAVCDLLVAMGAWSGAVSVMSPALFGATSAALTPRRDPETDELLPVDGWDARCPVPKPETRCWYE